MWRHFIYLFFLAAVITETHLLSSAKLMWISITLYNAGFIQGGPIQFLGTCMFHRRMYTGLFHHKMWQQKKNTKNRTKQNENKYNSSLSLQFVLYIFTAHYTVDYYKHEIHLRTSLLVWNKITLGRSKPKWSWHRLTTIITIADILKMTQHYDICCVCLFTAANGTKRNSCLGLKLVGLVWRLG